MHAAGERPVFVICLSKNGSDKDTSSASCPAAVQAWFFGRFYRLRLCAPAEIDIGLQHGRDFSGVLSRRQTCSL